MLAVAGFSKLSLAAANSWYTIDVYANFDQTLPADVEGRFYLGSVRVRTNGAGVAAFVFTGNNPPPGVQKFTATATDSAGNTSQFSAAITTGA